MDEDFVNLRRPSQRDGEGDQIELQQSFKLVELCEKLLGVTLDKSQQVIHKID